MGRTQQGNNNAYCQDNEISWYDWDAADEDLVAFTAAALAMRRSHPALRPTEYLRGPDDGSTQMVLYRPDGRQMEEADWTNPLARTLAVGLDGRCDPDPDPDRDGRARPDRLLLLLNAHVDGVEFTVPGDAGTWEVALASGELPVSTVVTGGHSILVEGSSLVLLQQKG